MSTLLKHHRIHGKYLDDAHINDANTKTTNVEISKDNEPEITIDKSHHFKKRSQTIINSIDELVLDYQIEFSNLYIPKESKADKLLQLIIVIRNKIYVIILLVIWCYHGYLPYIH